MSLRVWLPLNGDLRQQGASGANIVNNSATVNTAGKIGSCYAFNGSSQYLYSEYNFYSPQYSTCAWVYSTSSSATQTVICNRTTTGSGFSIFLIGGKLRIDPGGQNIQWTTSYTYPINTWFHLGITYDGTKVSYYINGEYKESHTCALSSGYWKNLTSFGASYGTQGAYGNYLNGRLNDIRIYDHCLSAAEVREIAQGLVLHYPLNKNSLKPIGTNLVTGVTKGGQTSLLTDGRVGVVTSGTSADTYFTVNLSESITSGTTYYLSCDVSGVSDSQYWGFPLGAQSNTSMPSKFYNGHNVYIFTANDINWGTNRLFLDDNYRNDYAHPASFYNFVLIKNPTFEELDCSGYNRNGTFNNIINIVSDTARYSSAIEFPGTSYIKLTSPSTEVKTVSLWAKWNTIPSGQSIIYVDQKSKTGLGLASNGIIVNTNQTGHTFNKSSLVANTWYHFVIVSPNGSSNATRQLYINGVEQAALSSTNSWSYTIDELQLGKRSTSSDGFNGKISDFRMYCTALTADDVLALYHTGAKVDNKANIHTYEINENGANKLTKTGILYDNMIESIKVLPDGSYWQLLLFHYVDNGNNLFTSSNATNCNDFGLYSRLKDINNFTYNGKYEFYVIQDDIEYRWTQTNQPTASSVSGLTTVSGYANPVNGLAKASQSYTYIGYGTWWGACGAWTKYSTGGKTGIPGFGTHDVNGMCTRYLALYARIEKPDAKLSNQTANSFEFIEL